MASSASRPGNQSSRRHLSRYFDDARRVQEERTCPRTAKKTSPRTPSEKAKARIRELVEPHLFYVVRVATELQARDVPLEELLAEGNMGLVEAAHRYDPRHEVKFLTYAVWWIRKRMLDYLNREGKPVRMTRYARDRQRELQNLREELSRSLRREPTLAELSEASGMPEDFLASHHPARLQILSLDQVNHPDHESSLLDRLARNEDPTPEERVDHHFSWRRVREEIAKLPPRPRMIIENRFGLDGREAMTFQQIGEALGMSRERARQLEKETLARLRLRLLRPARPSAD